MQCKWKITSIIYPLSVCLFMGYVIYALKLRMFVPRVLPRMLLWEMYGVWLSKNQIDGLDENHPCKRCAKLNIFVKVMTLCECV